MALTSQVNILIGKHLWINICCPHVRTLSFDDNNNVLKTHELSNGCYKYFRMSGNSILIPAKIAQSLKKEPKPIKEVKVFLWKNGRLIWKLDVWFQRPKLRQKQVWGLIENRRPILEIGRSVFKQAEASVFPCGKTDVRFWETDVQNWEGREPISPW